MKQPLFRALALLALVCCADHVPAQSTAFNYQGVLSDQGGPADGVYDMTFALFTINSGGNPVGTVTNDSVSVSKGLFMTTLMFESDVFDGTDYWLEIAVRTHDGSVFTSLSPRQFLYSTAYAVYANKARKVVNPAFLGTTIDAPLEFFVNNMRALRLEPSANTQSVNVTMGSPSNLLHPGVEESVIAGGSGNAVSISSGQTTISGGVNNSVGYAAGGHVIAGGVDNRIGSLSSYNVISGGTDNYVGANSDGNNIAGGYRNEIGSQVSCNSIVGGSDNEISGTSSYSSIGGGQGNAISLNVQGSNIAGGRRHSISGFGHDSVIAGGYENSISTGGVGAGILGGTLNTIENDVMNSAIASGSNNRIRETVVGSVIGGGWSNNIGVGASYAFVGSGKGNSVGTNCVAASIAGGRNNSVRSDYGTITGGKEARTANYGQQAYGNGAFETVGDAQTSTYVCRGTSTNEALTELFLDGASERMHVESNSTWAFDALATARASNGSSGSYQIRGTIKNDNGVTSFAGPPVFSRLGGDDPTWDVIVIADDSNDALTVNVLGTIDVAIRWVVSVRTVEVGY